MNQSANLFQLQKIDREIDRIYERIQTIDKLLLQDEMVIQAESRSSIARQKTILSRQALHSVESDTKALSLKKEQSEASLYSGKIKNPKELKDLEIEISSLKKRIDALVEIQIEKMIELETCEANEKRVLEELENIRADSISQNSVLNGEKVHLEQLMNRNKTERNVITRSISPENIEIYDRLRIQKKGIAVASIQEIACTACGASLRPAEVQLSKSSKEMFFCSSCGRILYSG